MKRTLMNHHLAMAMIVLSSSSNIAITPPEPLELPEPVFWKPKEHGNVNGKRKRNPNRWR